MQTTTKRFNGQVHGAKASTTERKEAKKRVQRWLPRPDRALYLAAAICPWALAILLLMVSMPHLASGFQTITGSGPLAGWLLAIAIDSAQVTAKLQLTMTKQYATTEAAKWTAAGIIAATSLMSAALNVLAFLAGATNTTGTVLAWTAGILLPLLVLSLSYTGSALALAKVRRQPKAKGRGHK
jgi:hypothetical protein